jgi:hypothetical protein
MVDVQSESETVPARQRRAGGAGRGPPVLGSKPASLFPATNFGGSAAQVDAAKLSKQPGSGTGAPSRRGLTRRNVAAQVLLVERRAPQPAGALSAGPPAGMSPIRSDCLTVGHSPRSPSAQTHPPECRRQNVAARMSPPECRRPAPGLSGLTANPGPTAGSTTTPSQIRAGVRRISESRGKSGWCFSSGVTTGPTSMGCKPTAWI